MNNQTIKASDIVYLPINLQLFAEDDELDISDDDGSVVDFQEEPEYGDEDLDFVREIDPDPSDESEDDEELADPQDEDDEDEDDKRQGPAENAQFKKMRLKAEAEAQKKFEAREAELQRKEQELQDAQTERQLRQEYLSDQKIWDKADEKGVSEEVAKELLEAEFTKTLQAEKQKVKERFEAVQAQKARYKDDPFFDEVDKLSTQAMNANPSLDYDTAYKYYADDYWRGNIKDVKKKAKEEEGKVVKRTVANIQDSMRRRTVPAGGSGDSPNDASILTAKGKRMALELGIDPRETAKYVRKQLKQKD